MIRIRRGIVSKILEKYSDMIIAEVLVENVCVKAIHLSQNGGLLRVGQEVILNTTARDLRLGTGGYDFVLYADGNDFLNPVNQGHIMKLRYTPYQLKVQSVEEQDSKYHQLLSEVSDIGGIPVVVAPLHSMLAPIVSVLKTLRPRTRVVYLMSDGAALPMAFSETVRNLKTQGLIEGTVSFGHAFGGDLEAVNVYTALLAARYVLKADIVIISMGPGIVGTSTPLGFTGVEQADFLHAVSILKGEPLMVPRISFADLRIRHWGISHHSLTVLGKLALVSCKLALPELNGEKSEIINTQLQASGITEKHIISWRKTDGVKDILSKISGELKTMGRGFADDQEYFLTAGLAGELAVELSCEVENNLQDFAKQS